MASDSHIHDGNAGPRQSPYAKKEPEGETFFDDGREIQLLHFVYSQPNIEEIRGSPQKVIEAISEYAKTKYLMNVGLMKGKIVSDLILEHKPEVMVELGGYIGFSAIMFGDAVRKAGGKRYYSLERNPEFAAVIKSLVDLAGLSDIVKVEVGASDASIARLHRNGAIKKIDLMFLDHYKPAYTTDLKLCETLGLVQPGTVLCGDNCYSPGNPPYLAYVRSTVDEKREKLKQGGASGYDFEGMKDRSVNQYKSRYGEEKPGQDAPGNPDIKYDSKMIWSWEPSGEVDGVEYTRCIGVES